MTRSNPGPVGQRTVPERALRVLRRDDEERVVERALTLAFLPLHKSMLGIAVGVTAASGIAAVTMFGMMRGGEVQTGLSLLAVYFRGYSVTWTGLMIGAAWGGVAGFVSGWFVAFCRNLVLATWLISIRVRANAAQTRDFLDHI